MHTGRQAHEATTVYMTVKYFENKSGATYTGPDELPTEQPRYRCLYGYNWKKQTV